VKEKGKTTTTTTNEKKKRERKVFSLPRLQLRRVEAYLLVNMGPVAGGRCSRGKIDL